MTTKHELERMGQLRIDNVEACIRFHGCRVGAPDHIVEFAVDRGKRAITEGGRSGAYARNAGEETIDFFMEILQGSDPNVVPIRRAKA